MCLACRERKPQGELTRIRLEGEEWKIDQPAQGRSIYWCGSPKCLKVISSRGKAAWGLKRPIRQEMLAELCLRLGSRSRYN